MFLSFCFDNQKRASPKITVELCQFTGSAETRKERVVLFPRAVINYLR